SYFEGQFGVWDTQGGPLRIASYGDPSRPRPILGGASTPLRLHNSSDTRLSDVVIDGLDLSSGDGRAFIAQTDRYAGGLAFQLDNIHVLGTRFRSSNTTNGWTPLVQIYAHYGIPFDPTRGEAFVFWNCTFDREALAGDGSYQQALDLDATRFVSVVGGTISGGGTGPQGSPYHSHHVYANVYDHLMLRW